MSTIIPKEHLNTLYVRCFEFLKDGDIIYLRHNNTPLKINTMRSKHLNTAFGKVSNQQISSRKKTVYHISIIIF